MYKKYLVFELAALSVAGFALSNPSIAQTIADRDVVEKRKSVIEEVRVLADAFFKDTTAVSPTSVITAEQLKTLNITTVEDALAHQPSLVIRKRFIGDPNGVVGIRGSNMFQTPRTMVFVDGMPLHYHLQTRFRGSPRWSLVSPDEVASAEVIYGPYSSQYSGNAMGGVVNIKTRRPSQSLTTIELGAFSQYYDRLLTDESYEGYRAYVAHEDKVGNLGYSVSYTRLDNESQPQTQFFRRPDSGSFSTAFANSGSIPSGNDTKGLAGIYFGDSGPENAKTDLVKAKFFYHRDYVEFRGSVAYEQRSRVENQANNFLSDANGAPIFDREVDINGINYDTSNFGTSAFQTRNQQRESLLIGLGASFDLANDWVADVFYSYFDVLDDTEIRSGANPSDSNFISINDRNRARITSYDDTGWNIVDLKFSTDSLAGKENQRLSLGFHYDSYELDFIVDNYNSITGQRASNELDGDRSTGRADSGGEAQTIAAFAQYGTALSERWDLSLGLRYDDWLGENGYVGGANSADRSEDGFSTKASIAYSPTDRRTFRYSVAQALRFPVIEEIFVNNASVRGGSVADATLNPEDGVFHNLSFEQLFENGSVTVNFFHEDVDDVIFNQTSSITGVTTFLPVDTVKTDGAELIIASNDVLGLPVDVTFNTTYTDAKISSNANNPEIVGKRFPRIPEFRSNLILNYRVNDQFNFGGSIRYAGNSFGELDNSDTENNTFGAHTRYTFVGLKANWNISPNLHVSAGIDNVFDEVAYVFHPWPARTFHLSFKYVIPNS
jgi:iron complex outermembrane receptor protein